jgi:rhodanese-related sulfurtransferase
MKHLKHLSWLLIVILALFVIGCSNDDDDNGTGPSAPTDYLSDIAALGDAYFAATKNITAANLWNDIQGGAELFIIDFRSAAAFDTCGHIENAVNWSLGSLMDNLSQIPATAKVICVCYTGQSASQATSILNILGYDAYNLMWGMCGWTSQVSINLGRWANVTPGGQQLETTANPFPGTFELPEVTPEASSVAEAIEILANTYFDAGTKNISAADLYTLINNGDPLDDPYIVNYFPEANYNAGHIPGAYHLNTGSFGEEELAYLPTDQQIVVYCYTGQTSSQLTSYLNVLGYNAYSLLYGLNSITDDPVVLNNPSTGNPVVYTPPTTDYPVVTGP